MLSTAGRQGIFEKSFEKWYADITGHNFMKRNVHTPGVQTRMNDRNSIGKEWRLRVQGAEYNDTTQHFSNLDFYLQRSKRRRVSINILLACTALQRELTYR